MDRFRVKGHWSTDPASERQLPGILTFSHAKGLRLILDGSFTTDYPGPDAYETIYGIADQAKWGRFVKLTRCLRTRSTIVLSGSASEEVAPTFAFFGSQPFDEGELHLSRATVRFEHLNEWAGAGRGLSLKTAANGAFALSYEPTSPASCKSDTRTLQLRYVPLWRGTSSGFRVKEHAQFEYLLSDATSVEQLLDSHIRPLHDFLTFAVDTPTSITHLAVAPTTEESKPIPQIVVFYKSTYTKERPEAVNPEEMLFRLSDIEDSFEALLNQWFPLHRSLRAFFGAFLGLVYAPPKFAEIRFDWTFHCVELLYAADRHASALSSSESSDQAIEWLLQSTRELGTMVTSGKSETFVARVRDARNRVQHGANINGIELHWLTEALRSIMKAFLLTRLTPTAPLAHALFDRRPDLAYATRQLESAVLSADSQDIT